VESRKKKEKNELLPRDPKHLELKLGLLRTQLCVARIENSLRYYEYMYIRIHLTLMEAGVYFNVLVWFIVVSVDNTS
jgi:hypothetical protein